jgi:hypothetical protein
MTALVELENWVMSCTKPRLPRLSWENSDDLAGLLNNSRGQVENLVLLLINEE